jgi:hypothetical protein
MSARLRDSRVSTPSRASTASRIVAGTELFDLPSGPTAAILAKLPVLDEGFDRFVDEERIAARPSVQSFGELPGSGRVGRIGARAAR